MNHLKFSSSAMGNGEVRICGMLLPIRILTGFQLKLSKPRICFPML